MCFSFEVSLGTFIITWFISLYLLNKNLTMNEYHNVIFIMLFSTMQLIDAVFWYTNMKKSNLNYILTSYIIPLLLSMQIIYNIFIINKNVNIYIKLISLLVCIYLFYVFNGLYTVNSNNILSSPRWGGSETNMIYAFIIIFFILISYGRIGFKGDKLCHLLIGLLTLIITFTFTGGYTSIWCALACSLSFYYLYKY